jgi:hypothetical protein
MKESYPEGSFADSKIKYLFADNLTSISVNMLTRSSVEEMFCPKLTEVLGRIDEVDGKKTACGGLFSCYSLVKVYFPQLRSIGDCGLLNCTKIADLMLPELLTIGAGGL